MKVRNGQTGEIIEVPDGTTDDEIHAQFSGAQQQNVTPLAQSFAQGAQQVVPQIAQQLIQGPEQSTLPNIGGGAMVGLTPQQAQFTLQQAQQSNVDSMANKLRQQQMIQQSLESEADRAQTLKLQQQSLKNQIAERKLMTEQAKFEAEQRAKMEDLKQKGLSEREALKLQKPLNVSAGAAVLDPVTGTEIYKNEKTFAPAKPPAPPEPKLIETIENGKPVQKWVLPEVGQTYEQPPSQQSTASQVTEKDWFRDGPQILKEAMAQELQEAQAKDPAATIDPVGWRAVNEPRYRQNMGLPPFKSAAAEEGFRKAAAEMALKQIMSTKADSEIVGGGLNEFKKQAEAAATYEVNKMKMSDEQAAEILDVQQKARAKGIELTLKFDPNGTSFLEAPDDVTDAQLAEIGQ